jgi:uncharacterized protein
MKQDAINFDRIDDHGPQTYEQSYELTVEDIAREEVAGAGQASIKTEVAKGDGPGDYVADGTVSFTADLECARCAEPYPFAITSPFHVTFRPRPEASSEEEVEITAEEELDVEFYSERTIPLRDFTLEQIQLSIPMKPLCDESCLGLCPTCGANLASGKCSCNEGVTDERWGALQSIREELAKKKNV